MLQHLRISAAVATLAAAPLSLADVHEIPLNLNFNGIVHVNEAHAPDAPNGFRSISDRGLNFVEGVPEGLQFSGMPGSTLTYFLVNESSALDIVHLGNRNAVDNGNHVFDGEADGDNRGVQPAWLVNVDQTGPQTTTLPTPLVLTSAAQVGFLFQTSNGGADIDVTLHFADETAVTVRVTAPDWYQAASPPPPEAGSGLAWQATMGTFPGTANRDIGEPGPDLNVVEAVVSGDSLVGDLGFDVNGRTLTAVTFSNASCHESPCSTAFFALSVEDGAGATTPCSVDLNSDGVVDVFDLLAYLDGWFAGCP